VRLLDTAGNPISEDAHHVCVAAGRDGNTDGSRQGNDSESAGQAAHLATGFARRFTWGVHEGPVIPVLAVLRINGQFFAFVAINEGKGTVARQTPLKLAILIGNDFVVLDGLKAGDHLIISGTQFLQDGMPVTEQSRVKARTFSPVVTSTS